MAFRRTGTQKIFQKRIIVEEGLFWSGRGDFSSSGKLLSGRQKAADYVKMLNDLSLAQEGRGLCGEEWIFQQDNAAIHNASITKKYLLKQKNKTSWPPSVLSRPQSYRKLWGLIVAKVYERNRQYSAISELKNVILDAWENLPSVQLQKLIDRGKGFILFPVVLFQKWT